MRVLRLDRPEKRNALNAGLCAALVEAMQAADAAADVAAVVLAGAGPGFSAGADLGERAVLAADEAARQRRSALSDALLAAPAAMGKPVVAAVHGAVVGAGASLALCCDLVVAAEDARFSYPEARHDIFPSLVAPMLLRHLGPKDCFELLATGRAVEAAEARALRLVNQVVPREALIDAACALAEGAALYGAESMRRIKAMIGASGLTT
ncbi:enoyl-CoA hydratase [Siccirubricoccus deserti]|nr:enoyl-CoA hydratase [Siccirubricoccus deserti]